ncbi:hypothetical protein [Rhodanobacter ginsengiterrae]|uniref:hypothetical protein n=1 Tax=Rhodanobacter ginsengiterrae TaxID=2008451 RepID=UPI003CF91242
MTKTRTVWHYPVKRLLLAGSFVLAPLGTAAAWQSTTQPAIRPVPPSVQFQQAAQQQKVRDDLQQSQLQQQLHNAVSETAKRPSANDTRSQDQLDKARQAQRERDRAAQQDLLDRERDAQPLPRVVPKALPTSSQGGG